jgi:hypothetical protein
MTSTQFDNGYWYAIELKDFAERIGIPSASKLGKDELGRIESPTMGRQTFRGHQFQFMRQQ